MFSVMSVCLSCLSVCLSVCMCLSVQTITFEPLHIGTSFLAWRYILTISRSSLSIKVIGSRSRSCAKFDYLKLISTCYSFVCTYRPLIRSRSRSHQGQGQIKVNIKLRSFLRRDTLNAGGLHLNQMRSCLMFVQGMDGEYFEGKGAILIVLV